MKQEVFMPNGKLIFSTENESLMYDKHTVQSMLKNGYMVKVDGKKVRASREK